MSGFRSVKKKFPRVLRFTQMFLELNSTGGETMIKNLKPVTQDWGKKIEETQHLTSAEASVGCSQGCTAGSVESRKPRATQRAGSCKASSGRTPFDLPNSQGSGFLHPRMPSPGKLAEVTESDPAEQTRLVESREIQSRSHREPAGTSEDQSPGHSASLVGPQPPTPPSLLFLLFQQEASGKASSLLWRGVHFLSKLSEFKGPWMV